MTNIIKFQAPFERLKDNNNNPDIALIKAIVLQSIIDASNISNLKEARKEEINAKAWIYGGSEDFQLMCEYINYDVDHVRKIAKNIENLHKINSLKIKKKEKRKSTPNQDILTKELLEKKISSYF
jgi:hypothetical protein